MGDLLVGCFQGFLHHLPGTDDGFAEESWLKDAEGKEISTSQFYGLQERKWVKTTQVEGVPDNLLGLYPDFADWDGDGDLDLMIGTRRGGIGLRINEGSADEPKWSATPRYVEADGEPIQLESHVSSDMVDLDGDGLLDLVCAEHGGKIHVFRNAGNKMEPKFGEPMVIDGFVDGPVLYPRISAADMNGDGKVDLVVGANSKTREPGIWVYHQE